MLMEIKPCSETALIPTGRRRMMAESGCCDRYSTTKASQRDAPADGEIRRLHRSMMLQGMVQRV